MRPQTLTAPFFFALTLAACDGSGGGAGAGGTGGSTDTGGSTGTTDTTTSTALYDANGCLVGHVPSDGASCPRDAECKYAGGKAGCAMDPGVLAICADATWSVYTALTCADPGPLTCAPLGKWTVSTTAPYYDAETDYYPSMFEGWDTFIFEIVQDPNGLVRVDNDYLGALSADGCQITLSFGTDEDCAEIDGEQFCSWLEGSLTLDLTQEPVTGTSHMECWGECGDRGTAPVEAHKAP